MKFKFSRQIFKKSQNIKFHKNPFLGSRAVLCGRTDRLIMTKLTFAFRSFPKAPKKETKLVVSFMFSYG
jgi:hypothetical protein